MSYRILLAPVLLSAAVMSAQGQVPGPGLPVRTRSRPVPVVPGAGPTSSPADVASTAASVVGLLASGRGCGPLLAVSILRARTPAQPGVVMENPRLARLQQLQFDRRPSAILKAWAKRKDPKTTPKGPAKPPLDVELEKFQENVTLGDWPAVKAYLVGLPAAEGKVATQLLQSLQNGPAASGVPGGFSGRMIRGPDGSLMQAQRPEANVFTADDVIGLANALPGGQAPEQTAGLGAILRLALDAHTVSPDVVARLKMEVDRGKDKSSWTARRAAQVLMAANEPVAAGSFLPGLEKVIADKDGEGLNLLTRHLLGLHAEQKKAVFLEQAWSATQAVLALESAKSEDKEEAVKRAVELAPKIKEELGQAWLEQSFTHAPERGMTILAAIGTAVAQGQETNPQNREERLKTLQLQKTAVEALLKSAPQLARQWQRTLFLLAGAWMREADYTQQMDTGGSGAGGMRVIRRGRVTYTRWYGDPDMMLRQQNMPLPLHAAELLRTRPEKGWMDQLDVGPRAKLAGLLAHLYLKADDEKNAFPFIEELAPYHRDAARDLVNEFLGAWTTAHDPNASRQDDDGMGFSYGWFSRGGNTGEGIPLTRSKQERNLEDLAAWVERIRRLRLDRVDEDLLVTAFTKCHSSAEVYRLDAIEKVFGPMPQIKPRTLATLMQTTRANLAGLWREPAEQVKKKTNRKQKDIELEVLRGYELADKVLDEALKQYPDEWSLNLARAALLHDETNYRQEVAKSADFSKKREQAIANFQKAAALYADQVKKLSEDEESIAVYQQWFNAGLGATDLSQIDEDKLPDPRQPPLIRKAILALPGEVAERHMSRMAEALVQGLGSVRPPVRHRYLKQGFAVVGEHKQAAKAKQVFDYYKDLLKEIKLEAVLDGSDRVGHQQPIGLFVNIRHTREIEREAGGVGFAKYLQNQNSGGYYSYYGRAPTDYRDRFEAAVKEALKDQFDVLSVTFQSDKVHSRAVREYGWRVTPYAYLLLKPRGPQVDKIPPLRLDLDFEDTAGDNLGSGQSANYVVLPIESPALPIDATTAKGDARPVRKLQVTQILNEREADKGKLGLEIRATGVGLVGTLEDTLDLRPEGFEVVQVNDQGLSVAKFDEEGEGNFIVSERTWLVELRAQQDRAAAPQTYRFAASRVEGAEMSYQRYQDADLAVVGPEVALENEYQGRGRAWLWVAGGGLAVLVLLLLSAVVVVWRRRPRAVSGVPLPEKLTPFSVTALLRRIQRSGGLDPSDQEALDRTIAELERHFFADAGGNGEIDLRAVAENWARRAK